MMTDTSGKDRLYSNPLEKIEDFKFDKEVVDVFDDMIHRSIPGYDAIVSMIGVLAEHYVQPETVCYDLGCSLGAVTRSISSNISDRTCNLIAVDNSAAMIDELVRILGEQSLDTKLKVDVRCGDVRDLEISNSSFIVMNFVLQFISPDERMPLVKKIYDGLNSGGVFVLSEKISFNDSREEQFQIDMYHEFKKLNGYSDLEISQKRTALEKILIPDSIEFHKNRLSEAGFKRLYIWFQCFNFVSIVAFK